MCELLSTVRSNRETMVPIPVTGEYCAFANGLTEHNKRMQMRMAATDDRKSTVQYVVVFFSNPPLAAMIAILATVPIPHPMQAAVVLMLFALLLYDST